MFFVPWQVGIEGVRAEVMPAGKADVVRSLQKDRSIVTMVGDGINDSPALTAADVGWPFAVALTL